MVQPRLNVATMSMEIGTLSVLKNALLQLIHLCTQSTSLPVLNVTRDSVIHRDSTISLLLQKEGHQGRTEGV